jgi:type IV fimbrial biogenesis protein FimT
MLLKNRNGFTLIEIMTVLAIMAILMAVGIPSYIGYKPTLVLNRAVNEYYGLLQQARLKAIKNRGTCTITFAPDPADMSYTLACTGSSYSRRVDYSDYGNLVVFQRPDDAVTDFTGKSPNITFNSRGSCNSGYLWLTNTPASNPEERDFYRVGTLISGVVKKDKVYLVGGSIKTEAL